MSEGPMKITRSDAFQICPEWVLLADISAQAVRLYLVLSKASDNETKTHHWGRKKIAEAMRLKSPRSVDRYLGELAAIGAVKVNAQFQDGRQTTNEYQVITVDPSQYSARGVADSCTPGVADSCTPGVAENCSQSYNPYDLKTSTDLLTVADAPAKSDDGQAVEQAKDDPATPGEFEQWYAVFPRKAKRPQAQAAFAKARRKVSFETLMEGAHRWANAGLEKQFTPYPASWLNGAQWEDEPPLPRNGRPSTMDRMMKLQALKGQNAQWTTPQTTPRALPGMM